MLQRLSFSVPPSSLNSTKYQVADLHSKSSSLLYSLTVRNQPALSVYLYVASSTHLNDFSGFLGASIHFSDSVGKSNNERLCLRQRFRCCSPPELLSSLWTPLVTRTSHETHETFPHFVHRGIDHLTERVGEGVCVELRLRTVLVV